MKLAKTLAAKSIHLQMRELMKRIGLALKVKFIDINTRIKLEHAVKAQMGKGHAHGHHHHREVDAELARK